MAPKPQGSAVSIKNRKIQPLRRAGPPKAGSGVSMSLSHCTLWGQAEGCGLLKNPSLRGACDMASQISDPVTVSVSKHCPLTVRDIFHL